MIVNSRTRRISAGQPSGITCARSVPPALAPRRQHVTSASVTCRTNAVAAHRLVL